MTENISINFDLIINGPYLYGRINPQNEAAKKGLERLEKQMKVCSSLLFSCYRD